MLLDPDRCVIVILTLCLVTAVQQVCSLADLVAVNEDGTVEGRSNGQIGPGDGQAVLVRARRAALSLSQADKDGALALHNSLRASVNGSNLKHMVWDSRLADLAVQWAQNCQWEHGQPSGATLPYSWVGQNLYFTTGAFDANKGIQAWFDEITDYDYKTTTCAVGKQCGHYTQIVWADSDHLGCGAAQCAVLSDGKGRTWNNANYLVCNYGPGGNYKGEKPFAKGDECTQCSGGSSWCYKGLCRDCPSDGITAQCSCQARCQNCGTLNSATCTCSCAAGWLGPQCSEICQDKDSKCGANPGWPESWCSSKPYVLKGCPAMCGKCVKSSSGTPACTTTVKSPASTKSTTISDPTPSTTVKQSGPSSSTASGSTPTTTENSANQKTTPTSAAASLTNAYMLFINQFLLIVYLWAVVGGRPFNI